ncbi:MAG TPA: hypothetical protein VN667_22060 [Burkholderiales bacterium]|nr:hypothetical protein [Burkholderiales bacterium]
MKIWRAGVALGRCSPSNGQAGEGRAAPAPSGKVMKKRCVTGCGARS